MYLAALFFILNVPKYKTKENVTIGKTQNCRRGTPAATASMYLYETIATDSEANNQGEESPHGLTHASWFDSHHSLFSQRLPV